MSEEARPPVNDCKPPSLVLILLELLEGVLRLGTLP